MTESRYSKTVSFRTGLLKQSLLLCPAIALSVSPLMTLSCMAQVVGTPTTTGINADVRSNTGTTILPTDVVPLAGDLERNSFGENMQLRILQRLPSRLYFSSSVEVTGRWESNPFQFPTKRTLLKQLPQPAVFRTLSTVQQAQIYDIIGLTGRSQGVFRALPNVSGGWTVTPHTRLFTNYFMIRDQLSHSNRLNTVIHSYAIGLQQDIPIGTKGSLQFEFQGRELWQLHQQSVFDYLPGLTFSYIVTPRMVAFVNALVQMRGKAPFQAPKKEIDPFYTWGLLYQKNGWTFSGSTTFVQNFREPFAGNATIKQDSYVFISDFEVARRVMKEYPGLQAFVRAEPIWNFHSAETPGLAGVDFRLFAGMRFAMAKPALTATLNQIREQLKETEPSAPTAPKPSAHEHILSPAELAAHNPQPIHGFLERDSLAETCMNPDGENVLIADDVPSNTETVSSENNQPAAPSNAIASSILESENDSSGPSSASNEVKESIAQASPQENGVNANPNSGSATVSAAAPESQVGESKRTLEMIAQSTAPASSHKPIDDHANILNVDSSSSDADAINVASLPVGSADSSGLHDLLNQAAVQSSSDALKERAEKIKEMSDRNEAQHKLAMLPLVPPSVAPKPLTTKTAIVSPLTVKPVAPTALPVLTVHQSENVQAPAPSALPRKSASIAGTAGTKLHSVTPNMTPVAKEPLKELPIKSVELANINKTLQPLPVASANLASEVPLHSMLTADKKIVQPVPIKSKISSNHAAAPAPIVAKIELPASVNVRPTGASVVEDSPTKESSARVHVAANKDGSIPVSALKTDSIAPVAKKESEKIASKPKEADKPSEIEKKMATIASASIPSVSANLPAAVSASPLKVESKKETLVAPTASAKLKLETTVVPAVPKVVQDDIAATVSSLDETEISSPKVAMAAYESWQSPVIDDPLIGEVERPAPKGKYAHLVTSERKFENKVDASKKKTEMKLIPPFPSVDQGAKQSLKNNSLDIKAPVIIH